MACFADIHVSHGSVATHARCGGIFNIHLIVDLLGNLPVRIFFKSVKIWQNYGHESVAALFGPPCICSTAICLRQERLNYSGRCDLEWGFSCERMIVCLQGSPRLRKALSVTYSPLFGRNIDTNEEILCTFGAYGSLFCAMQGLVNPGDEVCLLINSSAYLISAAIGVQNVWNQWHR